MEPFEIMVRESQERMLCVVEPARLQEVLAVCARWEVNGTAIGEVTDTRRLRVFDGDELVGDMPVTALVDECPAYDLEPAEPATPLYPAPPVVLTPTTRARSCSALLALGQPRLAQVGVRAVRLDRRLAHRPPPRGGRRRRPAAARRGERRRARPTLYPTRRRRRRRRGPRSRSRSTATAAASPPTPTAARSRPSSSARANLACVGAEPLGPDQLPELRQPREAAHRVAAHPRDRRPRRRLPRVRHPGRGRQRLALQRGRRGPDLPDARRRPRRRAARTPRRAGRLGFVAAGRRDRAGHAPAGRRRNAASELSKLRGEPVAGPAARPSTSASSRRCTPRSARPSAPARCTPRTTSPRAASRSRWPSARSPPASARRSPAARGELFGEGPGAFVVSGPAEALAAFGAAARVIGEVGGDALTIDGVLSASRSIDLERAHTTASPTSCTSLEYARRSGVVAGMTAPRRTADPRGDAMLRHPRTRRTDADRRAHARLRRRDAPHPRPRGHRAACSPPRCCSTRSSAATSTSLGAPPRRRRPPTPPTTRCSPTCAPASSTAAPDAPRGWIERAARLRPAPDRHRARRRRRRSSPRAAASSASRALRRRPRRGRGPRAPRPQPGARRRALRPARPPRHPLPAAGAHPAAPRRARSCGVSAHLPRRRRSPGQLGHQVVGHRLEDLDVRVDRRVVVGHRERPLLLAARAS